MPRVDSSPQTPLIIAFAGLPGTGKSTLAEWLATDLGAPAFAGDWLMGSLQPFGVLSGLERLPYLEMYYRLLGAATFRAGTRSTGATFSG